MMSLRKLILFFIAFFISSSILVDWEDYSCNSNSRSIERILLTEKFEELNSKFSQVTDGASIIKIKKRYIWIEDSLIFFSNTSVLKIQSSYVYNKDIRCALKSFLHLFQLY